jgi:hypothetical protein
MLPSLLYNGEKSKYISVADNRDELRSDLGLEAVLVAMAGGLPTVRETAFNILFESPAIDAGNILYRQRIAKDALNNSDLFYKLHGVLSSGLAAYEDLRQKSTPGYARVVPVTVRIRYASQMMDTLFTLAGETGLLLGKISACAESDGLSRFARMYGAFYTKDFLKSALDKSEAAGRISEGSRVTLGVKPGPGLKGTAYVIRDINQNRQFIKAVKKRNNEIVLDTIALQQKAIDLRDASAARLLSIINAVTAQTAEDFKTLYYELNFYIGILNLDKRMCALGLPSSFPVLCEDAGDALEFNGLADISLALGQNIKPVPNVLDLSGKLLTIVTGANQGGKSTFLRSLGCAQLMAQCGMIVAADNFIFSVRPRVFTHFCKPEDMSMESGKLDEERARLGYIVDRLKPGALLLMNESFSSTAEREGAAIARETIGAFCDAGVKVVFVTHLYEYAHAMNLDDNSGVVSLRAERRADGSRSFMIRPGISMPTSYGMDLFNELFIEI